MAQRGAWTPDKVRQRIQTSMLVKRLTDHALGNLELSKSQVLAIQILLRKSLPDLCAIEHSGNVSIRRADEYSDTELAAIAAGSRARASGSQDSEPEPDEIH